MNDRNRNRNRNLGDREQRLAKNEKEERKAFREEAGHKTRASDPDLVEYFRQGFGRRLATAGIPCSY